MNGKFHKFICIIVVLFISLSLQSCFSLESFHFIESEPKNISQIEVHGYGQGMCGNIETPQYSILVKAYNNIKGIESTCVGGMLFIPFELRRKKEADFGYLKKGDMYIDVGLFDKNSSNTIRFGDISILYLNNIYTSKILYSDLGHGSLDSEVNGVKRKYRWTRLVFTIPNFDPQNVFILSLKVLNQNGSDAGHKIEYIPKEKHEFHNYGERGC